MSDTISNLTVFTVYHDTRLGKGASSVVKLAIHKNSGEKAAVKEVDLLDHLKEYRREVQALNQLKHPNIIGFYGHSRKGVKGVIFLEYVRETLKDYLKRVGGSVSEVEAVLVTLQLADGLQYMHKQGICHCDLKPDNISYDVVVGKVKIFDFGFCEFLDATRSVSSTAARGSPLFMAPERVLRLKHKPFLAEIWSLGVVFYNLMVGVTPFEYVRNMDDLRAWMKAGRTSEIVSVDLPGNLSKEIREILSGMLVWLPQNRWSLERTKIHLDCFGRKLHTVHLKDVIVNMHVTV